jgi:mono/diheme cytochrome c family protein
VPAAKSNRNTRLLGILVLVVILLAASATIVNTARNWSAISTARRLKNPVPPTAEAIAAAKQDYVEHCQSCHGEKGDGKGRKAPELSVAPGDFTDARTMSRRTDGELFWQITRGRLPMPAFEDKLTDQQRWQLVDYIRTFAAK